MSEEVRVKVYFSSEFYLEWILLDQLPSLLWLKNALHCLNTPYPFYARYSGFNSPHKTMAQMAAKLNRVIELINHEGFYHISERAPEHFDQEFSNTIHHHFELLLGSIENFSEFYQKSSPLVKGAIPVLNHLIHDMETAHRQRASAHKTFAAICCEMPEAPRYRMPKEFYQYFQKDTEFGDMVAHYGMVGKTWWEVFLDRDEHIFPDAIRPLNIVSGEFDLFFGEYRWDQSTKDKFRQFLLEQGQDPENPELGVGYLPLARLVPIEGWKQEDYKARLAQTKGVSRVEIQQSKTIIAARDFIIHDGFMSFEKIKLATQMHFALKVPYHVVDLEVGEDNEAEIIFEIPLSEQFYTLGLRVLTPSQEKIKIHFLQFGLVGEVGAEEYLQLLIDSKTGKGLIYNPNYQRNEHQ